MAEEEEVQTDNGGDSSSTKTVVVIIVVVALAALGFYLLSNRSAEDEGMTTEGDEVVVEDEGMEPGSVDEEKLMVFRNFVEQMEPALSEEGQESLQIVVIFVESNPEVLSGGVDIPEDIMAAAEAVWAEAQDLWNGSIVVSDEDEAMPGEEEITVAVGDVVTLDGTFELTDIESPFGPVFSVVSNVNGKTYYLVFDETETERVMDFVGQEVTMEVEVTGRAEDGSKVGFMVVEGPTLADEAMIEDEAMMEDEVMEEVIEEPVE